MTDLQLLRAVRALIATPGRWTQGTFGRLPGGDRISDDILGNRDYEAGTVNRPARLALSAATCLCLSGAALVAERFERVEAAWRLATVLGFGDAVAMARWNDAPGRTHADVLQRLDAAIAGLTDAAPP